MAKCRELEKVIEEQPEEVMYYSIVIHRRNKIKMYIDHLAFENMKMLMNGCYTMTRPELIDALNQHTRECEKCREVYLKQVPKWSKIWYKTSVKTWKRNGRKWEKPSMSEYKNIEKRAIEMI